MIKQFTTNNLTILKKYFPTCFKNDGSFDLYSFKQYLKDENLVISNEGYELKFLGKDYARLIASIDPNTILVPDIEHNALQENINSKNIYITGDNLDGLKHLLNSYQNEVDVIFIDPPYNTGNDNFTYKDNFHFIPQELSKKLNINFQEAQRILEFTTKRSSSHSAWLTFMLPRLFLARFLLKEDGLIFVSIDNNEVANLTLLLNEIFGEYNYIGTILWKKKTNGNNVGILPAVHDYILCYAKNKDCVREIGLPPNLEDIEKKYSNPDNDPRGPWKTSDLSANHKGPYFGIENPLTAEIFYPPKGRYWVFSEDEVKKRLKDGRIIFGKSGRARPVQRIFLKDKEDHKIKIDSWWDNNGFNSEATKELNNIFKYPKLFTHAKPTALIKDLINISTDNKHPHLILDFFSGSATTAHAVLELNSHDLGYRNFIMIQIPELLDHSEFKTVADLGKERIKRISEKLKLNNKNLDLGFKHYSLKNSYESLDNLIEFDPIKVDSIINENNILQKFGVNSLLTTWANLDGYGLTTNPEIIELVDYKAFYYKKNNTGGHLYFLEPKITPEIIEELLRMYEEGFEAHNIILFSYSFSWKEIEEFKNNIKRFNKSNSNFKINLEVRY